jgi:hypothetical protein
VYLFWTIFANIFIKRNRTSVIGQFMGIKTLINYLPAKKKTKNYFKNNRIHK